jgi:hypothetical protein
MASKQERASGRLSVACSFFVAVRDRLRKALTQLPCLPGEHQDLWGAGEGRAETNRGFADDAASSRRLRSFGFNILKANQACTLPQDRYRAALGGFEALAALAYI